MFERYTETARRVIFFARYEASQFGSAYIESEHLLLGLLREDKALANRFLHSHAAVESIRKEIEGRSDVRAATSTSVDLPLSHISKRVLAYAAEEGERLSHKHIGTEHLLLGLLREEGCLAAEILNGRGLNLSTIREELGRQPHEKSLPVRPKETSLLSKFGRDLTQAAMEGKSHQLVDRDNELKRVVQILCRCTNNNPLLIGESDAVRSSIVEALAQRIADGDVPPFLEDKRIVSLDLSLLQAETSGPTQFKERLKVLIQEVSEAKNVLIFIEELFTPITSVFADVWLDAASFLTPPLLLGALQCIAATTPSGYSKVIGKHGSLAECFQQVTVTPPNEAECMKILASIKERYETFHGVTFDDDSIAAALLLAKKDTSERSLLTKAEDLLDEAGAYVQIHRRDSVPQEFRDVQKRIKFIVHRMEDAVRNHEFEKSRFYADEERKERENLRRLQEERQIDVAAVVTPKDIQEVVRLRAGTV